MKRLNGYRMRLMLVGFVAAIVLGGGRANGDSIWRQKADMPTTRYQHSTSVVAGKIYAIGGLNHATRTDEYDPTTDTWTRKVDMPTAVGYTSTCVLNDKIYVIGGDPSHDISIVQAYDPSTDTWEVQTQVPSRKQRASTIMMNGVIYVFGGVTDNGEVPTVEAYDPTTDIWMRKADMPTARQMACSCVVNGRIYSIGGFAFWSVRADVEEYDPTTDTWTVKAPMPTARCLLGTSVVDGKIYAIGGYDYGNDVIVSTVEVYDPPTDTWTKGVDIPIPTEGLSTSVVDEKIYVFGGYSDTYGDLSAVYANEAIVDFNGDGIVDSADMCIMIDHWGESYSLCDIGPTPLGDGIVDVEDLKVLSENLFEDINDPTLVAHWSLDETEGDIAYNSAADCDGTLIGNPVWHSDGGMLAGALQFDGIDDYVSTDPVLNPADGKFSAIVWVKGGAPGQAVLSQADGVSWLCLDSTEGCLMTELTNSGRSTVGPMLSQAIITDDNWHRIGFVWDGSCRHLYVDGVEVAKDAAPLSALEGSDGGLYIGCGKNMQPGTFFSGLIDDVRIYNRAVSP